MNSNQIHTIRDVLAPPPSNAMIEVSLSDTVRTSSGKAFKWYYSPGAPMAAALYRFSHHSAAAPTVSPHYGYLNHPMHCFFLTHCLVDLQKFCSHALGVVKTIYGSVRESGSAADPVTTVSHPFLRSPAALVQEALALYSIRDYDSSQVSMLASICFQLRAQYFRMRFIDRAVSKSFVKETRTALIISIRFPIFYTLKNRKLNCAI